MTDHIIYGNCKAKTSPSTRGGCQLRLLVFWVFGAFYPSGMALSNAVSSGPFAFPLGVGSARWARNRASSGVVWLIVVARHLIGELPCALTNALTALCSSPGVSFRRFPRIYSKLPLRSIFKPKPLRRVRRIPVDIDVLAKRRMRAFIRVLKYLFAAITRNYQSPSVLTNQYIQVRRII